MATSISYSASVFYYYYYYYHNYINVFMCTLYRTDTCDDSASEPPEWIKDGRPIGLTRQIDFSQTANKTSASLIGSGVWNFPEKSQGKAKLREYLILRSGP